MSSRVQLLNSTFLRIEVDVLHHAHDGGGDALAVHGGQELVGPDVQHVVLPRVVPHHALPVLQN